MSEVRVNKLSPRSGTTVTLGDSGDTITIPSGVTLANSGTFTNFQSTGIDDNATSTAITIDSSQNVGIGTASPQNKLHLDIGTDNTGIRVNSTDATTGIALADNGGSIVTQTTSSGAFRVLVGGDANTPGDNSSEAMRIDSYGNVGIGTSSPTSLLHIYSAEPTLIIQDGGLYGTNATPALSFQDANGAMGSINYSSTGLMRINQVKNNDLTFATNNTEHMRIDSSGNLLVGQTTNGITGLGIGLVPNGVSHFYTSGERALELGRGTSDGEILRFNRSGTAVGSIGVNNSDNLFIGGNASNHSGIEFSASAVLPRNNNTLSSNSVDLGNNSVLWQDIYATNGTIQTSDANEKQSIQSLTTAEMNVAKKLSSLIKTFKWNSSVEEKGDSARTHTGIIAQDVQQAFTDEGLDAGNYALFISSTWWEKEISVEATEEKDAYTYMDTKEEATEGYTERTRLGVRYSELLSFIQAYNDQRFTELEARITALENQP